MGNMRVVPNPANDDSTGTTEAGYTMPQEVREMGAYITALVDFGTVTSEVGMELLSRLARVAECGFNDCVTAIGYAVAEIESTASNIVTDHYENVPNIEELVRERDPLPGDRA